MVASPAILRLKEAVADLPATKQNLRMETLLEPMRDALPDMLDSLTPKTYYITIDPPYFMRLRYVILGGNGRLANLDCHYFFDKIQRI